jgi:hypothetical protein
MANLSTADVLAALAPPLHLRDGPDVILLRATRDGGAGFTALLQNPYDAPLAVNFSIVADREALPDRITVDLGPLEVGILSVPVVSGGQVEVAMAGTPEDRHASRIRAKSEGRIDATGTVKRLLSGIGELAVLGVGRFGVVYRGGDVEQPLKADWSITEPLGLPVIEYERLWAPSAEPPVHFLVERTPGKETFREWVQYLRLFGAFFVAPIAVGLAMKAFGLAPEAHWGWWLLTGVVMFALLFAVTGAILKRFLGSGTVRVARSALPGLIGTGGELRGPAAASGP